MQYKHQPESLEDIRARSKTVRNALLDAHKKFTPVERFAVVVTEEVGSMGFFFVLLAWTLGWLAWNLYAPIGVRFDPAPAFVIWLFVSNVIQLVLLPLIMVGQNLEGRADARRAEADFHINEKTEKLVESILAQLENQHELLLEIARKVER